MANEIIGQVLLNQYRVDGFIASGGMGAVYKVWDLQRNVPLAMKILHAEMAEDPHIYKRFQREANALKKLAHPNIVPFYGLFQTQDFAFLLERYIDGPTLSELLKAHPGQPLPIPQTLAYLNAITAALGYAHAHGVVHCDIKPGNIMLDQGGTIYLTDFGIARHAESSTTTLGGAGTPGYMAPEQIRSEPVTPATDVYALGCLFFEMLTGQRPFKGTEAGTANAGPTAAERIRYAQQHIPPPNPHNLNPNIPEALADVILKCLAKNPSTRYQEARQVYEEACSSTGGAPMDSVVEPAYFSPNPVIPSTRTLPGWLNRKTIPLFALALILIISVFLLLNSNKPAISSPLIAQMPTLTSETSLNISATTTSTPSIIQADASTLTPTQTLLPTLPPTPSLAPTLTRPIIPIAINSPDKPLGRIVYICQIFSDENRNQICLINADGSGQKRISTDDNEDYLYATLTPDGQNVLYAGRTGPVYQIYKMKVDGSGVTQLTDNTYGSYDADVSPDGSSIVYVDNIDASDQSNAIWVMDQDGSNQHQVFGPPDGSGWDPIWSPDGHQILFMRDIKTSYQLFIMNKDGSNLHQVSNISQLRGRSDWALDGNTLTTYAGTAWHRELYLLNKDGTNIRQITHGGNSQGPSFSPDGNWIAFTAYFDKMGNANGCEIYIIRLKDLKVTRLTNNNYCSWQPRWGP